MRRNTRFVVRALLAEATSGGLKSRGLAVNDVADFFERPFVCKGKVRLILDRSGSRVLE